MKIGDYIHLIGFTTVFGGIVYTLTVPFFEAELRETFDKHPKTVDSEALDASDVHGLERFCRCLKSKQFPYCDGSHVQHNLKNKNKIYPLVLYNEERICPSSDDEAHQEQQEREMHEEEEEPSKSFSKSYSKIDAEEEEQEEEESSDEESYGSYDD